MLALAGVCAAQRAELRSAPALALPAATDSNSPAFWQDRELVVYSSTGDGPVFSAGPNKSRLHVSMPVVLGQSIHRPYWIEAVWRDEEDGTVYGWYHHEPAGLCKGSRLTAPEIGALVSHDGGRSFSDLGIILSSPYPLNCSAQNGYFGGGNGDFTVVLGRAGTYFYFLFSNYGGPLEEQGVAIARLPFARKSSPFGAVEKYYNGSWNEPGTGGFATPVFRVSVAWERANADAFWGPSIHWNTYLEKYVMLLNRSCCSPGWPQEGVYVSYSDSLWDPDGWSPPKKLIDGGGWYPQVLGDGPGGTDSKAGHKSRFYMNGVSEWDITFEKDPEEPSTVN